MADWNKIRSNNVKEQWRGRILSEIACFPGKDGHVPLSLYNGSIMMAGQAPIHDECAESLALPSVFLLLKLKTIT